MILDLLGHFGPLGPKGPNFRHTGPIFDEKNLFCLKNDFLCYGNQFKIIFEEKKFGEKLFFRPPGENFFRPARPARRPLVGPAGAAKIAKNVITGTSNPSETIKQPQKPQKSV